MMVYQIVLNPHVEKRVREEIKEVMDTDDYSHENLKRCSYIENVLKETIRLYPPVPRLFSRIAMDDGYINEVPIKKGSLLNY